MPDWFFNITVDKITDVQMNPELYWNDSQSKIQKCTSKELHVWPVSPGAEQQLNYTRKSDKQSIEVKLTEDTVCTVPMEKVRNALQKFDLDRLLLLRDLYQDVSCYDGCYEVKRKYHEAGFIMKSDGYWYKKFNNREALLEYALPKH